MDDWVNLVRQITEYPLKAGAGIGDAVLLQTGGLGGAYAYTTVQGLYEGLQVPGQQLGVGEVLPGDAVNTGILTTNLLTPLGCTIGWNFYQSANGPAVLDPGAAGRFCFDGNTLSFARSTGAAPFLGWSTLLSLGPGGALTLPADTLTVARDPVAALEVATKQFVEAAIRTVVANSVWSFNGRKGNVSLLLSDIVAAGGAPNNSPQFTGCPTVPTIRGLDNRSDQIANADWVQQVIVCRINDLLVGYPFVTRFNGRVGDVWLCDQDLIAAGGLTPASRIDATTIIAPRPPECPRQGQLWWDSDKTPHGGALYVWYVDGGTGAWVVANSQEGSQGPQGPPGSTIKDSFPTLLALQTAHPTGQVGDAYLVAGDMYVWDPEPPPGAWKNVGSLVGPTGPMGPAGPPTYLLGSTPPAAGFGEAWLNTTDNSLQFFDGTNWLEIGYLRLDGGTVTGDVTFEKDVQIDGDARVDGTLTCEDLEVTGTSSALIRGTLVVDKTATFEEVMTLSGAREVEDVAPQAGDALTWNATASQWTPGLLGGQFVAVTANSYQATARDEWIRVAANTWVTVNLPNPPTPLPAGKTYRVTVDAHSDNYSLLFFAPYKLLLPGGWQQFGTSIPYALTIPPAADSQDILAKWDGSVWYVTNLGNPITATTPAVVIPGKLTGVPVFAMGSGDPWGPPATADVMLVTDVSNVQMPAPTPDGRVIRVISSANGEVSFTTSTSGNAPFLLNVTAGWFHAGPDFWTGLSNIMPITELLFVAGDGVWWVTNEGATAIASNFPGGPVTLIGKAPGNVVVRTTTGTYTAQPTDDYVFYNLTSNVPSGIALPAPSACPVGKIIRVTVNANPAPSPFLINSGGTLMVMTGVSTWALQGATYAISGLNAGQLAFINSGTNWYLINQGPILSSSNGNAVGGVLPSANIVTFTTSGTYTMSAGTRYAVIECIGGGGGGGGATGNASFISIGGGGGAGGYSRSIIAGGAGLANITVTIGAGGAASGSTTNGTNTSFGTAVVANGGSGGITSNGTTGGGAGNGGTLGTGQIRFPGNDGYFGKISPISSTTSWVSGGRGGGGTYGGEVYTGANTAGGQAAGTNARANTGSGGCGGWAAAGTTGTVNGGAGGSGICIITEYIF